jgi:predicted enzyme related to lactoylglutathione lyase
MPHVDKHVPGEFCWLELATTDQASAKTFYSSLLGWQANDNQMGPDEIYTIFKLDGRDAAAGYTMRADERSMGIPPHWNLYIAVSNADEAAAKAAQLGGKVLVPAFDVGDFGRMAVVQDPAGAVFCVWQAKQHIGIGISGDPSAFCWADLSTPNRDGAKEFYSKLFGWTLVTGEGKDPSDYLHIKNGESFIGGVPPSGHRDPHAPPHWLVYFAVSNLANSARKAKELGATFYVPPMNIEGVGELAVCADPQGAVFSLFQAAAQSVHA